MERVGALIKRMLEQYEARADTGNMILTAQMLLNELQQMNKELTVTGKKVAVIMPAAQSMETNKAANKNYYEGKAPLNNQRATESHKEIHQQATQKDTIASEINFYDNAAVKDKPAENKEAGTPVTLSHTIEDFPTFTYQQKNVHEVNDAVAQQGESLNDRLKVEKVELGNKLKDAPVRDLRKAIGINDRFVFINELFRGDENMYERSIKTINSFNILAEAEYWIQRELKVKIGWNESSETVKHFDQLVRRRFS
jgi:hypothetical protein